MQLINLYKANSLRALLVLAGILIFAATHAEAQKIAFKQYSLEDGLSEAEVRAIIQDNSGLMWIATRYGLNRFDGRHFKNFYTEDGLADNKLHSLLEDKNKRLWVGTANGISIRDGDRFYTPSAFRSLEEKIISCLYEDVEGNIWIGTDSYGVYRWNPNSEELSIFNTENGLISNDIRDILQTRNGIIWLATREGLTGYLNNQFRHYSKEDGLASNRIRALAQSPEYDLLIGTRGGLTVLSGGTFINYGAKQGLLNEKITDLVTTKDGKLWIATEDGIALKEGSNFTLYSLIDGLPVNIYECIWLDRHNQAWFGSFGSGLIKLLGDAVIRYDSEFPFPERVIRSFGNITSSYLWIGTYGGGLVRLRKDNAVQTYRMPNGLTDDKVYSLLEDEKGVWIGTQGGLDYFTEKDFINFFPNTLPFRKIRDIEKDADTLWLASYGDGLIKYNISQKTFTQYTDQNYNLPSNSLEQVLKDQQGRIWIGTYSGLAVLENDEVEFLSIEDGLPNNAITHISMDHEGIVWVSTYKGFARIQGEDIFAFDELSGLPGDLCFFIIQDKWNDQIYWVGTNQGLIRFDLDAFFNGEHAFMVFNEEYGLLKGEFNEAAATWFGDRLMVGTVNGMMAIDTRRLKPDTTASEILLTDSRVLGQPMENFSRKSLSYDQNFISFEYTGIDFIAPSQLQYEHRLRPVESSFTQTTESSIRYSALPPGDYWFEVNALNNSGIRSIEPARMHFVIKAPFWQQWWFISILILVIVGIMMFIYNYLKINRLIDIERMRVRIASDLHDDVGASLTEIALNTDFLMATNSEPTVQEPLKQIGGLARNVVSSLDDIVWSIDARNDTAGDLGDRIQDTAGQIFRNQATKIHFDFDASQNQRALPVEVRENVFLIIKEALNNAAKYSNAKNIHVRIKFKGSKLWVEVEDDGIGLSNHKSERKGNGILNMKMRAERIRANLHITGEHGTTIRITDIRI